MHLIALTASAPNAGRRVVAVSATYTDPAAAAAEQIDRCGERYDEESPLAVNLACGTGLALFSPSDGRRVALVNPGDTNVFAVAAHLYDTTPGAEQWATVGKLIAAHIYTYGIDAYGPDPEEEGRTRTTYGPAGLRHIEAIDLLAHRMRDLSGNGDCPNESGNWLIFAHEVLDRAASQPTRPQTAGVTDKYGVIVTAEPVPGLGKALEHAGTVDVDTTRPAVALVTRPQVSVVCGYWQPDGSWADAPVSEGRGGLLEEIGKQVNAGGEKGSVVSVVCQGFSGAMTRPFLYYPGPPEVGPVDLPTDPDREPSP